MSGGNGVGNVNGTGNWTGEWVAERLGVSLTGSAELRSLLGLALRRNPRRAHLLVSNVLGKHVPQDPSVVYGAGVRLGEAVRSALGAEDAGRSVVLGYAETATGLGHAAADGLGAAAYLHSTRRRVPGVRQAGGFEEEHSHATSHLVLPEDAGLLAGCGPLVLVDDELSTGRTICNTIAALQAAYERERYVVASLVDLRSAESRQAMEKFAADLGARVDVVALASGEVSLPEGVLARGQALVAEADALPTHPPAELAREGGSETEAAPPGRAGAARPGGSGALRASGAGAAGADRSETEAARAGGAGTGAAGADRSETEAARAGGAGTGVARADRSETEAARAGEVDREAIRVDLGWPEGLPDGGRHGFLPEHRERLESALPEMAVRLAESLAGTKAAGGRAARGAAPVPPEAGPQAAYGTGAEDESRAHRAHRALRVLVLGTEELMYAPLRLARALQAHLGDRAEIRFSTTTRSPVLAVDDPGYAIRTRLAFPSHDAPDDGPGERYAYNVAAPTGETGFDAIVAVTDTHGDTPELHAQGGLLDRLAAHTHRLLLAVIPSHRPLPQALRGPEFSSYAPDEVGWLLKDLSDVTLEAPTEEREEAIQQGGAHYAESLPVEYQPSPAYQALFHSALEDSAPRIAHAVATVTETVLAERSKRPVLVSLARAGTPVGILMRRWARHAHGLELAHYAVSIVRGRGIDATALDWLARHHDPADVVFVDGWTGKGAITRELAEALAGHPGFDPRIAVLADPGRCVDTYGTREDFLIPSACLNSTVSGLISRTVLRADLTGPGEFHGAKFYRELAGADLSGHFLDAISARFPDPGDVRPMPEPDSAERKPTWEGWAAVERISEAYGIGNVNLVKPGVGETTRVLLRRVPWKVLVKRGAGVDVEHVRLLARQRGVPVEEADGLPYTCVGLIHPQYTRGATGADGKAAAQ